jgi:hypothetical protein
MADPVSHTAVMSSMTEELAKNKYVPTVSGQRTTNQIILFPEPATKIRECQKMRA